MPKVFYFVQMGIGTGISVLVHLFAFEDIQPKTAQPFSPLLGKLALSSIAVQVEEWLS